MPTKLLAFAGSLRRESFNRKALDYAVAGAQAAGAEVDLIDLRDYSLPLFDQDRESANGVPDNAVALKRLFIEHAGLLLACPEYNSSITPLLKNTLDWVSRPWRGPIRLGAVPEQSCSPGRRQCQQPWGAQGLAPRAGNPHRAGCHGHSPPAGSKQG